MAIANSMLVALPDLNIGDVATFVSWLLGFRECVE